MSVSDEGRIKGREVKMTSLRCKMVSMLFRLLGVSRMLDKEGEAFEALLETYRIRQKKPLAVPYKKMRGFDVLSRTAAGTAVYVVRKQGTAPKKAVLYLFGGGYILPPDPGDIVLCGQIAEEADAEVWFPLYPMAPEHRLVRTVQSTLQVYREILKNFAPENVRFFGTFSGGGLAMSLCMYIRHEKLEVPLPGKLVLQSPGLQVPPNDTQKEEMQRLAKADIMIPPRFFDSIAPVLASGDEAYLLSPLLFDLTGFPPIDIFYGTREVMIAYLKDFKKVCRKYGVRLNVHIGRGMMHCWGAMEFVPEAKAVRQEYFRALR
jgi:acetyl esterase/lipase